MNDANIGNAASKTAVPIPTVCLNIIKHDRTSSEEQEQGVIDKGHIRWSLLPVVLAFLAVIGSPVNAAFVATSSSRISDSGLGLRVWGVLSILLAVVAIFLVDRFLVRLLISVVYRCYNTNDKSGYPGIPSRAAAFAILLLQLTALVFAFAQFNTLLRFNEIGSVGDAIVDAFVTTMTLNHGHYNLKGLGFLAHSAAALELSSTLLLLIVFVPLLVSRLAMFAGETAAPAPPRQPVFEIVVKGTVSCTIKSASKKKTGVDENTPAKFTVTDNGEIVPVRAATG